MELRPVKESRIFQEGYDPSRQSGSSLNIAKLSKIFYPLKDISREVSGNIKSSIHKINPKKLIKSEFENINLESLSQQPVNSLSFNPFEDAAPKASFKINPKILIGSFYFLVIMIGLLKINSYFSNHLMLGTSIAGQSVSLKTSAEAIDNLKSQNINNSKYFRLGPLL